MKERFETKLHKFGSFVSVKNYIDMIDYENIISIRIRKSSKSENWLITERRKK